MADPTPATQANRASVPWWATWFLALIVVFAFIGVTGLIAWRGEDKYEQMMLVALVGVVTTALGYYLGSSSTGDKTSATLTSIATSVPTASPEIDAAAKALAVKVTTP